MPELPEVEVIRRSLAPHLVGRRIARARLRAVALRRPLAAAALRRGLGGRAIVALGRRAKYLLLELDGGRVLVLHLGMSGRLSLVPRARPRERHEHLVLELAPGTGLGAAAAGDQDLRFRDPRRFGLALLLRSDELPASALFRHLGPEPLDPALTAEGLRGRARGRRAPIKNLLMDPRFIAGVGNIYAAEALHAAGIDPRAAAGALGRRRWQRLFAALRGVLQASIADGGTSLVDFRDGRGRRGLHRVALAVYGRAGRPCPRCGRRIRRLVQAGRSTFYCTRCQRRPPLTGSGALRKVARS